MGTVIFGDPEPDDDDEHAEKKPKVVFGEPEDPRKIVAEATPAERQKLNDRLLSGEYEHPSLKAQGQIFSHELSQIPLAGPALRHAGVTAEHPEVVAKYPKTTLHTRAAQGAVGGATLPVPPWYQAFKGSGALNALGRTAASTAGDVAIKGADLGLRASLGEKDLHPGEQLALSAGISGAAHTAGNVILPSAAFIGRKALRIPEEVHNAYKSRSRQINDVGTPRMIDGQKQSGREILQREMGQDLDRINSEVATAKNETSGAKQRLKEAYAAHRDEIGNAKSAYDAASDAERKAFAEKDQSIRGAVVPYEAAEKVVESRGVLNDQIQGNVAKAWKALEQNNKSFYVKPMLESLKARLDRFKIGNVPLDDSSEYQALADVYNKLSAIYNDSKANNNRGRMPAKDIKTFIDYLGKKGAGGGYDKRAANVHIDQYEREVMKIRDEMNENLYKIPEFAQAMGGVGNDVKLSKSAKSLLGRDVPKIQSNLKSIDYLSGEDPRLMALESMSRRTGIDPLESMTDYVAAKGIMGGGKPAMAQVRENLPEQQSVKDTLRKLEELRLKKESDLPQYGELQDYRLNNDMINDAYAPLKGKNATTLINNDPDQLRFNVKTLDALRTLDKSAGANNLGHIPYEERAKDLKTYEFLNRNITQGSRAEQLAKGLVGGPVSYVLSKLGISPSSAAVAGGVAGAASAASAEMDGRKMYKMIMDLSLDPKNAARVQRLKDAAQKGVAAFAATAGDMLKNDSSFEKWFRSYQYYFSDMKGDK